MSNNHEKKEGQNGCCFPIDTLQGTPNIVRIGLATAISYLFLPTLRMHQFGAISERERGGDSDRPDMVWRMGWVAER